MVKTVKNKQLRQVKAQLNRLRMAPRKVRLVCDLVRHLPLKKALEVLANTSKKAAPIVACLLDSAIANAVNNFQVSFDQLFLQALFVNEGRTLKRSRPRGRGSAFPILKRSAHLQVILGIKSNQSAAEVTK